ncbi:MAG: hypothetical protein OXU98_06720, partial [Gammaproteobacteria bacterium]|nr:hypothetical protein [Gammaproteobacteria bacterium]
IPLPHGMTAPGIFRPSPALRTGTVLKDSGFLIGEKQSRYRSLFFYHQELRFALVIKIETMMDT